LFTSTTQMELTADTDLFGIKELAGENTTSSALFPRLTNEVLKLDMAVQKTLVRFNGRGFEAASITAFSGVEPSKPTRDEFEVLHIQVDPNRPFGFIAVDRKSSLVLFTGWLHDPTECPNVCNVQYDVIAVEGALTRQIIAGSEKVPTVGRLAENDHVFGDTTVSRRRLTLRFGEGVITIKDHSKSGTKIKSINGQYQQKLRNDSSDIRVADLGGKIEIAIGKFCHIEFEEKNIYQKSCWEKKRGQEPNWKPRQISGGVHENVGLSSRQVSSLYFSPIAHCQTGNHAPNFYETAFRLSPQSARSPVQPNSAISQPPQDVSLTTESPPHQFRRPGHRQSSALSTILAVNAFRST